MTATELIVPGLYGSGPDHWQSWWLRQRPQSRLVAQRDWRRPDLDDWCATLAAAVRAHPGAILVGHSLGCAAIVHLACRQPFLPIGAALLVAPADVGRCGDLPQTAAQFGPLPECLLRFPAIVVASRNDAYMSLDRATILAAAWGVGLVDWGNSGHINAASGFGAWPAGTKLADHLADLAVTTPRRPSVVTGEPIAAADRA